MADPGDRLLFEAFREAGASEKTAYTAVQEVRNMAGRNIFAAIDALRIDFNGKIEAQAAKIEAQGDKIEAQKSMMWALIGILGAAILSGILGLAAMLYEILSNAR